jgi:hypothetical protein
MGPRDGLRVLTTRDRRRPRDLHGLIGFARDVPRRIAVLKSSRLVSLRVSHERRLSTFGLRASAGSHRVSEPSRRSSRAVKRERRRMRRGRDSNPRYPSGYSGFQDHRHRPLGHLSNIESAGTPAPRLAAFTRSRSVPAAPVHRRGPLLARRSNASLIIAKAGTPTNSLRYALARRSREARRRLALRQPVAPKRRMIQSAKADSLHSVRRAFSSEQKLSIRTILRQERWIPTLCSQGSQLQRKGSHR